MTAEGNISRRKITSVIEAIEKIDVMVILVSATWRSGGLVKEIHKFHCLSFEAGHRHS